MVENKRDKDRIIIRRPKSILIKNKSSGEAIKNNRRGRANKYYKISEKDENYAICTICKKSIPRTISHLRYHLKKDHDLEISERDAIIMFMTEEQIKRLSEPSNDYYFTYKRRPDIYVVTPGSGKKRI